MVRHFVRFVGLLMRGIYEYCHSQQIILVILLFVFTSGWGLVTREQSFTELMKNPWRPAFPVILTACFVAVPLIIRAALELNREIAKSAQDDKPRVTLVGDWSPPSTPSVIPGLVMGSFFVVFAVGLTLLAFWAGFSPSRSALRIAYLYPEVPKETAPILGPSAFPAPPRTKPIRAALLFGIDTPEFEKGGKLIPQTTAEFSLVDGIIAVPITAWAKGPVTAKNVTVIFRICIDCRFSEEPKNSLAPESSSLNKLSDRRVHFDTIYSNGPIDGELLKIKPPSVEHFTIFCMYACDNCGAATLPSEAQHLEIHIKQ